MTVNTPADDLYRLVMTVEPPAVETPFEAASRRFLFGEIWGRPDLGIRDRRLVSLACVAAADAATPIAGHVYAALRSGDLTIEQLNEVTLHFAVYCGWPKASFLEQTVRAQWQRLHEERGQEAPAWPTLTAEDLGPEDRAERIRGGQEEFRSVNVIPAPPSDSPYFYAGILNFVFGHVWRRPGLSRRERRLVTIPCVGASDAVGPIFSHVGSALESGDVSYEEMQEIILHFSAYYGFAKGEVLHDAARHWRAGRS
ncbi:4-carboxymuconolactone decarboxylase [Parafrankia irregularis]|uniref:4-carboxymuconolactone decarboxylase n=1 Tax=Parafrankia irregularis TaxID=795642 RepID=A0A0S4QSZ7_9ACTN|nr:MULTISPECIES: carboxymuconolactone decarboxylase family protein [Parafrankia]MBE3201776.1 carboxymuconolactone decarboxylase family protein [Parafrankia sp. CH37]CUU58255.1 4-carboxymuconolactone decarboxylase [Parafrankia irregularis]